ncbi:hypothetical protein BHE74_00038005 [Ensete ventricosum]|nr:hypothetical protein BHE74_00038005 [Ensete ventricosum]RZS02732.1 hypothetical protein BHM03_00032807 [Ensete ventricosum]
MEWDVRNMREHISSYKNACPSQLLATEEERRKKLTISLSLPPGLLQMKKLQHLALAFGTSFMVRDQRK